MEEKDELLQRLGKQDGNDEKRWQAAIVMAGELDHHVNFCFESLINLENKDFIFIDGRGGNDVMNQIMEAVVFIFAFSALFYFGYNFISNFGSVPFL